MATSRREKGTLFEAYYAATDLPPAVVIAFTFSSLTIAVHDSAFSEPSIWEIFDHPLHPSHGHSHYGRVFRSALNITIIPCLGIV